ncbi:hypothetical protein BGX29_008485 [Mortierella sp. GBA35]|nr:hypothetical protein BGX29_008485 [Mortierella sp. GBA35]
MSTVPPPPTVFDPTTVAAVPTLQPDPLAQLQQQVAEQQKQQVQNQVAVAVIIDTPDLDLCSSSDPTYIPAITAPPEPVSLMSPEIIPAKEVGAIGGDAAGQSSGGNDDCCCCDGGDSYSDCDCNCDCGSCTIM